MAKGRTDPQASKTVPITAQGTKYSVIHSSPWLPAEQQHALEAIMDRPFESALPFTTHTVQKEVLF